jgi:hypothetical protein
MNTIQFDWVKSQMPHHPQPVPPIYQPEICAKVVVDTAEKPRRRTWVGETTVFTIVGSRLSSRFADWYLARTGYQGQQAPDLHEPMVGPNLYEPVPGDRGARGAFDSRSHELTPQTWAIRHRGPTYAVGAILGALGAGVLLAGARHVVR